jgi:hypothetical protein
VAGERREQNEPAVEAKSARRVPDRALAGLRALAALRGVSRRLVVYLGDERLRTTDGIDVLPVPAFLDLLDAGRLF